MPVEIPWELVPENAPDLAGAARDQLALIADEREKRSFLWTRALSDAVFDRTDVLALAWRGFPDIAFISAGFMRLPHGLAPPKGVRTSRGFVFGVCVAPQPITEERVRFHSDKLSAGGIEFPVLVAPTRLVRHQGCARPANPSGARSGTAACWAEPRHVGANPLLLNQAGVLTAAHVASRVDTLTGMHPPSVHVLSSFGIDAAVLAPDPLPEHYQQLGVVPAVAGSLVDVQLAARTPATIQSATVLSVFDPASFIGKTVPHRIVIDTAFAPGDSGALVTRSGTLEAVGLYVGEVRDASGTVTGGACQALSQVVTEFDIDLFL